MMTGLNNITGKVFPAWEQSVSSVETGRSQRGNSVRSAGDARAMQGRSTLVGAWLRCVVLFVLMVVGVNGVKAQTVDYSGTYFIAYYGFGSGYYNDSNPANNYYWCPVECKTGIWEGWFDFYPDDDTDNDTQTDTYSTTDTEMDFLTTHKCRDGVYESRNAQWIITKHETLDAYYIQHKESSKYLTMNGSMKNASSTNRLRVHLQKDIAPNNKSLFGIVKHEVKSYGTSYVIKPYSQNQYINVSGLSTNSNTGNYDELYGTNGKQDGPTGLKNVGGTLGWYSDINDKNAQWFLEDYIKRPLITYNSDNLIEITDQTGSATNIYYTTDGTKPTTSSTPYNGPFDPPANTTTIKAIVIVNSEESNVATFTPPVFLGSTHKYLIQSQGNGWTIGNSLGCHYYMIPGDDENDKTKVNTTTMLRPSMQWYFLNAGDNYYYIVNNVNMTRMRYNTTSGIHMDTWDDNNANEFKFQIVESATAGTYNIIPYGLTTGYMYLNKPGGNADNRNLALYNNAPDANSRWKFVPQNTPLADTPPFTTSDANTSVYYKIQNGNGNSYFIIPPTTTNYATASNATDDATGKKMSWYFEKVKDPTDEDWLTYYKVVNAETGKALHYTEIANTSLNVGTYDDGDDNYKFAFVKSPTSNYYYIVPKSVKDDQLSQISMIWRDNNALKKGATRGNSGNIWTFTLADLFCNDPEFVEEDGKIRIKCNTNAAKIYINTESDADPTDVSTLYNPTQVTTQNWETNNQVRIKAIAIVNDGTNSASSAVITLLNKPDVMLETGLYKYNADDCVPTVTLSIGETTITTGFTPDYANNRNAGTASVTITDNEASDAWYIWNVPVTEFTIDKAPLTIKANDKTIGYGDEPDNDGVTYNGFVGDPAETESVLGGTLGYSYTTSGDDPHPYTPYDPQYGNRGSYVITPSGLTSTNYDITFESGELTVGKKSFGNGTLAEGFTLEFDEDNNVILKYGSHTLTEVVDYAIEDGEIGTKYSTRTINGTGNESGEGNYTGSLPIRNAIVHFTTDANQEEWSATFVAETENTDFGHTLPNDISAYIITGIEGSWAIPEPLDYIPTGIPVLLVAHEAKNGFVVTNVNKNDVSQDVQEAYELKKGYNMLKEVTNATSGYVTNTQSEYYQKAHFSTKQIYVLYNNEFVLNKDGYLDKGKVYMENPTYVAPSPAPSPAPTRLKIKWDTISGMAELRNDGLMESQNGPSTGSGIGWYTLDGRKLNGKPSAKGLYIVDGKKVMVK